MKKSSFEPRLDSKDSKLLIPETLLILQPLKWPCCHLEVYESKFTVKTNARKVAATTHQQKNCSQNLQCSQRSLFLPTYSATSNCGRRSAGLASWLSTANRDTADLG